MFTLELNGVSLPRLFHHEESAERAAAHNDGAKVVKVDDQLEWLLILKDAGEVSFYEDIGGSGRMIQIADRIANLKVKQSMDAERSQ